MNIFNSRSIVNKIVRSVCHKQRCFFSHHLTFGEEVLKAKERGTPIVALESTIITHGMPYPDNLETALEVEDIIRRKNVVPATIAIINGRIKVGASRTELEELSKNNQGLIKVSRRDFSYALSRGLTGGTTVSGTMLVAEKAGITIMATGGIGGVHREVESSMDVSADLKELGQTRVAVVCSGVKAILDIPKTLEFLESQGVPVVTIGDSRNFPAFYSRETFDKLESPMRVNDPQEAAALVTAQNQLGLNTGILLAVPIPREHSLDPQEVEKAIEEALGAAKRHKFITGKQVTPFLLEKLSALTGGTSLKANKALIKNNAAVAAEIALRLGSHSQSSSKSSNPVVIGGATYDTILQVDEPEIKLNGSTHKGRSLKSCGGVGRNLANALVNLGMSDTKFISVVGDDEPGRVVIESLKSAAETVQKMDVNTANYTAIVDSQGGCCFGIGEMEAFDKIDTRLVEQNMSALNESSMLILDGNPPLDTIKLALDVSRKGKKPVWYEPTDLHKALKVFQCGGEWRKVLSFVSPNLNELLTMAKHFEIDTDTPEVMAEQLVQQAEVPVIITTLGARGVLVTRRSSSQEEPFLDEQSNLVETCSRIESRLYPALEVVNEKEEIKSVSGCGDCLAAGIIIGLLRGWSESSCVYLGLNAARESLFSYQSVPDSLKSLPTTQDRYTRKLTHTHYVHK